MRPTTATTPPTSLPPTTTTAATATGLSDQLLALAIALPIASLLVLVLVLLAVCYCVWMRRSRDKSVENYPFTPSYNRCVQLGVGGAGMILLVCLLVCVNLVRLLYSVYYH